MSAGELIGSYRDVWHVEQSFRMSKTDLAPRPIFHRARDAIEAPLTIVFATLAIVRDLHNITGLTVNERTRLQQPASSLPFA
jgi:hypothetical protein